MENKLISMTAFVLNEKRFKEDDAVCNFRITNYAHFLSQPLKLEMFVPVGDDGNILEDRDLFYTTVPDGHSESLAIQYKEAKEKVLFEGCYAEKQTEYYSLYTSGDKLLWVGWNYSKKIEDILHADLTLTPTALKQIYG